MADVKTSELEDFNIDNLEKAVFTPEGVNSAAKKVKVKNTASEAIPVEFSPANTLTIFNVDAPVAGTEYNQALPANTTRFIIRPRLSATMQVAYVATESGTKYLTIKPNAVLEVEGVKLASTTIYFQTDVSSQTIEIKTWS